MFDKMRLKKKIKKCRKEIEFLEKKRSRSQAALVEAILRHTTPDDQDVDYFNKYTEKIDTVRNNMQELQRKLEQM